jgi:hypothetical protein
MGKSTWYTHQKYGNRKTDIDGITFDSKIESERYLQLKLMEQGGLIADLQTQVSYPLEVNGILVATYIADFEYDDLERKRRVTEDVKGGVKTREYKIKKRLMKALHNVDVQEVTKEHVYG